MLISRMSQERRIAVVFLQMIAMSRRVCMCVSNLGRETKQASQLANKQSDGRTDVRESLDLSSCADLI